jgi:hypothetical protein
MLFYPINIASAEVSMRYKLFLVFLIAIIAILIGSFAIVPKTLAQEGGRDAFGRDQGGDFGNGFLGAGEPSDCEAVNRLGTSLGDCEESNGDVVIGQGGKTRCTGTVLIDGNYNVGQITINRGGALVLNDQEAAAKNPKLTTKGINITQGGSLLIGCAGRPIGSSNPSTRVTITFTGARPNDCPASDTVATDKPSCHSKGVVVNAGATVQMYGLKGVPADGGVSWTYLARPAGPDTYSSTNNVLAPTISANTLYLANNVSGGNTPNGGWKANDWIVIATTSFSPFESEFVQIKDVQTHTPTDAEPWASVVTLNQPLQYYHFGGPNPYRNDCGATPDVNCKTPGLASYRAGAADNYGVDERAEVGLISRNIVLTSDADSTTANAHWGGELRLLMNFTSLRFQGVQLEKFGKEHLGSYPFHLHMAGNLEGKDVLLDADSVDHSYNKCVTVHSTQNATISNMVCARIVGHIFYQEWGDETNTTFANNLGVGAMSNGFAVNNGASSTNSDNSAQLIQKYWWNGDNMVTQQGGTLVYNGFQIVDTDNTQNPSHGTCQIYDSVSTSKGTLYNGSLNNPSGNDGMGHPYFLDPWLNYPKYSCPMPNGLYYEPASGFWITNISAKLRGNSIAGCQGFGNAYWLAPTPLSQYIPIGDRYAGQTHGELVNNRGHGCQSGIYSEGERTISQQPFGYDGGVHDATHQTVMNIVNGITLTRMRNRGIWLRPSFYLVRDARVATDRIGVSLVTSGGPDGNYPGEYSYLTDSVVVGVSQNNVDRFGNPACNVAVVAPALSQVAGGTWGCLDQTAAQVGTTPNGADYINLGYPLPSAGYDMLGYMIYDGPALIFHDRFVNFRVDPTSTKNSLTNLLDTWDTTFLKTTSNIPGGIYEGDAALGWFNSANPSAYPVLTSGKQLSFAGTDLRHQVFTQAVNTGSFGDGDKNTAIYDLDGTLSGLTLANSGNQQATHYFPISLNNLDFNATGYVAGQNICSGKSIGSVDECNAEGGLNASTEGIDTANMSPAEVGSLEFQAQWPLNSPLPSPPGKPIVVSQKVVFTRDDLDFLNSETQPYHSSMTLGSRNAQGIWEPKVASGFGYTVSVPQQTIGGITGSPGIPNIVQVGLVDVAKPGISSTNPYYVRIGICYTGTADSNTYHPPAASNFTITRGYQSWGGGGVVEDNATLRKYYNQLDGNLFGDNSTPGNGYCYNLTNQTPGDSNGIWLDQTLCPSKGISLAPNPTGNACGDNNGGCPNGTTCEVDKRNTPVCVNPTTSLTSVSSINGLISNNLPNLNAYYYDKSTGMLYFYVEQTEPNAVGPSPLGNCTDNSMDPAFCPNKAGGFDTYYVCPAQGCIQYKVTLADSGYQPGASNCNPYPTYNQTAPQMDYHLALSSNPSTPICRSDSLGNGNPLYPHYIGSPQPACPVDQP